MKESSCKSPLMTAYYQEVRKLEDKFQGIELHHVPRRDNDAADFLAKLAAKRDPSPSGVFINDIHEPSTCISEGPDQTRPNGQPALGGSDPDAKPALGGSDPGTSMTMHLRTSPYWHLIETRLASTTARLPP